MTTPEAFVQDMAAAGMTVEGPWDLVNTRQAYGQAVPVLLAWLERADTEVPASERQRFREGVVRSLAVKEARGRAGPALLAEFRRREGTFDYRWAVANTLEVVADQTICPKPLTILVGSDDIAFERNRQVVDRVSRVEVGAVVLEEYGMSGVRAVTVRGPSGDEVGRWETGWIGKGSIRPYRALRRHSWPRAIQGDGPMRWVSKDAPPFVRERVR